MKPMLKKNKKSYWGNTSNIIGKIPDNIKGDLSNVSGTLSNISGNLTNIKGNLTGIYGDVTGLSGNIDNCDLTNEDRKKGINIKYLINESSEVNLDAESKPEIKTTYKKFTIRNLR